MFYVYTKECSRDASTKPGHDKRFCWQHQKCKKTYGKKTVAPKKKKTQPKKKKERSPLYWVKQIEAGKKDLAGANLGYVNFADELNIGTNELNDMILDDAQFTESTIIGIDFRGGSMQRARFRGTFLANVMFKNVDMRNAYFILQGEDAPPEAISVLFENCNLSGATFGTNNMIGYRFHSCNLTGADFTNAKLEGASFYDSNLTNADFRGTGLIGVEWNKANIKGAKFTGPKPKVPKTDPEWVAVYKKEMAAIKRLKTIKGIISTDQANWVKYAKEGGKDLKGANLYEAQLQGLDLTEADFSGANLDDANFSGADLTGAIFTEASMNNTVFDYAGLAETNFADTALFEVSAKGANFNGANFSDARYLYFDASDAQFVYANLSGMYTDEPDIEELGVPTNFSGSNMQNAKLLNADLRGASFKGANLTNSNFTGAIVTSANFEGALLTGVKGLKK